MNTIRKYKKLFLNGLIINSLHITLLSTSFYISPHWFFFPLIFMIIISIIFQLMALLNLKGIMWPDSKDNPFGFSSQAYFVKYIISIILFTLLACISFLSFPKLSYNHSSVDLYVLPLIFIILQLLLRLYAIIRTYKRLMKEKKANSFYFYLKNSRDIDFCIYFLLDLSLFISTGVFTFIYCTHQKFSNWYSSPYGLFIFGSFFLLNALLIGYKLQHLMLGDSADHDLISKIQKMLLNEESIEDIISIKSMILGESEVLFFTCLRFNTRLNISEVGHIISGLEKEIMSHFKSIKTIIIKPIL